MYVKPLCSHMIVMDSQAAPIVVGSDAAQTPSRFSVRSSIPEATTSGGTHAKHAVSPGMTTWACLEKLSYVRGQEKYWRRKLLQCLNDGRAQGRESVIAQMAVRFCCRSRRYCRCWVGAAGDAQWGHRSTLREIPYCVLADRPPVCGPIQRPPTPLTPSRSAPIPGKSVPRQHNTGLGSKFRWPVAQKQVSCFQTRQAALGVVTGMEAAPCVGSVCQCQRGFESQHPWKFPAGRRYATMQGDLT